MPAGGPLGAKRLHARSPEAPFGPGDARGWIIRLGPNGPVFQSAGNAPIGPGHPRHAELLERWGRGALPLHPSMTPALRGGATAKRVSDTLTRLAAEKRAAGAPKAAKKRAASGAATVKPPPALAAPVLGRTTSGKAVHAQLDAGDRAYHHFTAGDHQDAARLYMQAARAQHTRQGQNAFYDAAAKHGAAAERIYRPAQAAGKR